MEQILELTDSFHQIDQQGKMGKNDLRIGEKEMVQKLQMDFVKCLSGKEAALHIQFGLPLVNPLTAIEDKPKDP